MKVTGYGKQTEWRVSIVTSSSSSSAHISTSSLPLPPTHHTYTLTSLNRDSAYQLEVTEKIERDKNENSGSSSEQARLVSILPSSHILHNHRCTKPIISIAGAPSP